MRQGFRWLLAGGCACLGSLSFTSGTLAAGHAKHAKRSFPGRLSGSRAQVERQLASIVDGLPGLPPLTQLVPALNSLPNISSIPGAPEIQGVTNGNQSSVTNPAAGGVFSPPFAAPGPVCAGETNGSPTPHDVVKGYANCPPAAVSVVVLPNSQVLYWDGLEAEESAKYSIVAEFGDSAANDQSRLLTLNPAGLQNLNFASLDLSTWQKPQNSDGGANGASQSEYLLPHMPGILGQVFNDQGQGSGALFCADQVILSNGEVLVPGGTDYYSEPHVPGTPFGVAELQGLRNTRIFNPATGAWSEAGNMSRGRWYPSLVTLASGKVFVASGVTKLLKPVYADNHVLDSGTNVEQTETFNPATGKWTQNPTSANHTFPLFPRLHLLPDGHVYYDAGGQTFNPFGQSYDEALWNFTASYDPARQQWTYLGVPFGISSDTSRPADTSITAGFRGSAASVMLPLKAPYNKASFLDAGGVLGTSPGAYFANTSSIIDTVAIDSAGEHFSSTPTGPLNNARWFSTTVMLPTGQAIAFNGANRDEVDLPGSTFPVTQAELFDPASGRWSPLADSGDPRTYHNTAALLPSGQVLVGGNAPIDNSYLYTQTFPGGFSNNWRDPSFQVYDPPYLKWGIPQPTISTVAANGSRLRTTSGRDDIGYGNTLTITSPDAGQIKSVVLVRNPAVTHIVDGDQRSVELPFTVHGDSITATAPPNGNVAPPGPYMLFINEGTAKGLIPSVSRQVFVGPQAGPVPSVKP
jgi:galactose oxidase-like protein